MKVVSRPPLTMVQIESLVAVMRDVFSYVLRLQRENPIAQYVQLPKVPSFLSESLAVHLINSARILDGVSGAHLAGRTADILANDRQGRQVKIEVKGTGISEWVFLGEKDHAADFLVWICFDDLFENPKQRNVRIFCIIPSTITERRQRITLQTLNQVVPGGIRSIDLDLVAFLGKR